VHQVAEKGYAFVEFRSVEEASNAMALDGVKFRDAYLKVRRGWARLAARACWRAAAAQPAAVAAPICTHLYCLPVTE
jgi:hypothetical protein